MEATTLSNADLSAQFPERRLESRTSKSVEIVLRGVDRWGKGFVEKTRTVNLSRTGAKTRTEHVVRPGSRVRVVIPHLERASWGTVAWVGEKAGNLQEIGIAVDETSDFWGVQLSEDLPDTQTGDTHATEMAAEMNGAIANPGLPPTAQPLAPAESRLGSLPSAREAGTASSSHLSNVFHEPAQSPIEQSLQKALQQLNQQTTAILRNMQELIAQQTQDRLRQSVEAALQQIEAAALDVIRQNQSAWQQRSKTLADSASFPACPVAAQTGPEVLQPPSDDRKT